MPRQPLLRLPGQYPAATPNHPLLRPSLSLPLPSAAAGRPAAAAGPSSRCHPISSSHASSLPSSPTRGDMFPVTGARYVAAWVRLEEVLARGPRAATCLAAAARSAAVQPRLRREGSDRWWRGHGGQLRGGLGPARGGAGARSSRGSLISATAARSVAVWPRLRREGSD